MQNMLISVCVCLAKNILSALRCLNSGVYLRFAPDSLKMSGLAIVTAAVKSPPLYSASNCHVTNCDCTVWKTQQCLFNLKHFRHAQTWTTTFVPWQYTTWNTALARIRSLRWNKECAFRLPEESISPISMGEPCEQRQAALQEHQLCSFDPVEKQSVYGAKILPYLCCPCLIGGAPRGSGTSMEPQHWHEMCGWPGFLGYVNQSWVEKSFATNCQSHKTQSIPPPFFTEKRKMYSWENPYNLCSLLTIINFILTNLASDD